MKREKLDQIALDVEFLLISVIQGVALATLASAAVQPLSTGQVFVWPYILAAFLLILIFWSGAIIHAVSFIDWPTDLVHSFEYFLASFFEILAITSLANPLMWYAFMFLFQIAGLFLYTYDLRLIMEHAKKFNLSKAGRALYSHILKEQKRELLYILPASIVFNGIAIAALVFKSELFITNNYHIVFITFQIIVAFIFLQHSIQTFKKRSELLTAMEE